MKTLLKSVLLLAATVAVGFSAEKKEKAPKLEWMTDFPAAQEKAKAENKSVLVNFTGSDWCPYCIKLEKEVFATPEFQEYATKNFVLVIADFPREKRIRPSIAKQNEKLQETYGAKGYPTVIVTDASGKKLAQTGYFEGGAVKWVTNLDSLLKAPH